MHRLIRGSVSNSATLQLNAVYAADVL